MTPPGRPYAGNRLPVLKIDAVTVTSDLPPTVSAPARSGTRPEPDNASLSRPSVEIPSLKIDYPVIRDFPTQGDFVEEARPDANNSKNNKKSDDDTSKSRELSSKLPPNAQLQQLFRPPISTLQAGGNLQLQAKPQEAPAAVVPPVQAEPKAATLTLPLLGTFPLPSKENVALASTTAVTATFVAVLGKAAFEASLEGIKPLLRLMAIRYKKMRNRDLSDQELQMEFSFEMKRKGKRTFAQSMGDLRDYFKDNFFDDLIG